MKDQDDMTNGSPSEADEPAMCGDGSDMEHAPAEAEENGQHSGKQRKREKPLKIHGTLNDVLRAAMPNDKDIREK